MTIFWKAEGITSVGSTSEPREDHVISIGTTLTAAVKAAIGKHLDVSIPANSLAFLLICITERYPQVIRALAAELDPSYEPPKPGGGHDYALSLRLRAAANEAIASYLP